jgi:pentatricopeptide repeat protein
MQNKSNLPFRPAHHAIQLNLIGVVRGLSSAEDYFNKLPEKEKTEKAFGALLHCYVRERLQDKAVAHMQKMKQLGLAFTPLPYNDIMCLYAALGQHEKLHSVLAEMKEDGVLPNNFSYKLCINSHGMRSDMCTMEKLLKEMEQQPHIVMDWNTYTMVANIYIKSGFPDKALVPLKKAEENMRKGEAIAYNHIISLYGIMCDKPAILRLLELQKKHCKKLINRDYTNMLGALVKIGELEDAEMLLKEWVSSQKFLDFRVLNVLLVAYQANGLIEKAEALLDEFLKKGKKPRPHSWGIVAAGYAEKGEMERAHEMMKNALRVYVPNAGWTPNPEIVRSILCYLGERGELADVETFTGLLKVARPMDGDMYYALIKARIRAGEQVEDLLKSLQDDGIKDDKNIKEILASVEGEK